MTILIYTLLIKLYAFAISIAALFSRKARQWVEGRRDLFQRLSKAIDAKDKWIWFHVSSLGEFEQGRPLIEMMKAKHPEYAVLLTFFSPSGYLIRKDYSHADYVTYMPIDTPSNARRFLEIVKPRIAVFIKYDIWYHHLKELEKKNIPAFLVSANLRSDQIYFKPIGNFLGERLRRMQHIFTQTSECASMLKQKGFNNVTHAGDTRLDRAIALASAHKDFQWLKASMYDQPILVAGSTWPGDEEKLIPTIATTKHTLIIAPHEIHQTRIRDLEKQLPGSARLSRLTPGMKEKYSAVIVDSIGNLAHLYSIADIAYVGGGFGKGIHNILEPAAYGIPVLFGPKYQKFVEAVALIEAGAAKSITTADELIEAIEYFRRDDSKEKARKAIEVYIEIQRGATKKVYDYLTKFLK